MRNILGFVVVLGLGAALAWRLWPQSLVPPLVPPNVDVEMSARGIELVQSRQGRMLWRLRAASGAVDAGGQLLRIEAPVVDYFPEADGQPVNIRGPRGEVDQGRGTMRLFPQATAVQGPATLTADELTYDGGNLLEAHGQVRLVRGRTTLAAPHAAFDLARGEFTAHQGVEVTLGSGFQSPMEPRS